MEKAQLEKCWKLLNGVSVLLKEVDTDINARRLKMAIRDVCLVREMLAKELDKVNQE